MRKAFYILLFFISSCGYQPFYINKNLENFEFQKITSTGNNEINNKIINTLSIKENNNNNLNKLIIKSSSQINETSKNTKGQVESFRTNISVNLEIRDKENNIIQSKSFLKEFTYSNKQNKFELVEYQNAIQDDLVNEIIGEIIIYLNL